MKKEDLLLLLDSWDNLSLLINGNGKHHEYFDLLMDISLNDNSHKSWRAAYMADKIHDEYPDLILPYINKIIQILPILTNSSKKRHFLKLLSMHDLEKKHFGFLVDYCLNTLTSANEPPAVRVHAMQILFNISEKERELQPELIDIIEHEMEYHATPGIKTRGSKLVKKLKKNRARNNLL